MERCSAGSINKAFHKNTKPLDGLRPKFKKLSSMGPREATVCNVNNWQANNSKKTIPIN